MSFGHQIDVITHKGHTVIIEPLQRLSHLLFQEWEYCEKKWYLENQKGASGVIRALLYPTTSGVGCQEFTKPRWIRQPQHLEGRWTFDISRENLDNMNIFLKSEISQPFYEFPNWFKGKTPYHLFHNCHHFAARALKAANIPISPWWAFTDKLISLQLDKACKIISRPYNSRFMVMS